MESLISSMPILLKASLLTLALGVFAFLFATLLGGIGAALKISGGRMGAEIVNLYTTLVRGIPDLVLLVIVYYNLEKLINAILGIVHLPKVSLSVFTSGVLALGFIYGAYLTETFRGAYLAVPKGQTEAAQALGIGVFARLYKVILPQMIRFALPGWANVWQVLVKATAVVSVIGFEDLVGLANDRGKTEGEPFVFMVFVMAVYLIYTSGASVFFKWMERKYAPKGVRA